MKNMVYYVCSECGQQQTKWFGQCPNCHQWNVLEKQQTKNSGKLKAKTAYSGQHQPVKRLNEVSLVHRERISTSSEEFNRVIGGGVVPGSVILLGGDPGVGKSSILLQMSNALARREEVMYISGEESLEQIATRANRMELDTTRLTCATETDVDAIIKLFKQPGFSIGVIDSIQTLYNSESSGAPGGISQVRESVHSLTQYAKYQQISLFLVGHVTKGGDLAGPRVLEHMVDTVIYIENQDKGKFRLMRSIKNRFGPVNEIGLFAMTPKGLKEVKNPSALFLNRTEENISGSVITSIWEGSRPLLTEIQALSDKIQNNNGPKRVSNGIDGNRLAILLAVLHRHGHISSENKDIFINVVGGVKIIDTSSDLAVILAIVSSIYDCCVPKNWLIFGEIGLSGEIRAVTHGEDRVLEASKHGFTKAIIPKDNQPKKALKDLNVTTVKNLQEALETILYQ